MIDNENIREKLKTPFRELSVEQQQRRLYFAYLSLQGFNAFKMHKAIGLWEKKHGPGEQVSWRNVSEHCLVEMARVKVLANTLSLPKVIQKDLLDAAALHDFYKEQEIKILKTRGATWANYAKASKIASNIMEEAGIRERVIWLVNAVGHESLLETIRILQKSRLSEGDLAFLIMHFVDDFTRDVLWVEPTLVLDNGKFINELDRRMEKNERNSTYKQLNEEGRKIFNGETTFHAQGRIGHFVEERLANLIGEATHQKIHPRHLAELVDSGVKTAIASVHLKKERAGKNEREPGEGFIHL